MSAYVNRLIDRFSPTEADVRAHAEPFVRSHSPIAQFDQRPGDHDSLGFDRFAESDESTDLGEPAAVAPTARIHRKAVNASPAVHAPAPALAPTPVAPSLSPAVPRVASPTPRREPMDPGPLFDVVPRYFDASAPPAVIPSPAPLELGPSSREAAPSLPAPTPSKRTAVSFELDPAPRRLTPPPVRQLELRVPSIDTPRPAPWQPVEPDLPARTPIQVPLVTPTRPRPLVPASPSLAPAAEPEPTASPRHYASPRPPAPAPYVPAPGPRPSADPSVSARPRVHIGRVEIEVIPSATPAPAQSGTSAPRQKLSIDSISQIGPLGQHFPSRRRLRLRYR
jgi:hypothetical protein